MNAAQIEFNKTFIKNAYVQIAALQKELANPRLRKPEYRIGDIEGLRVAIAEALERLYSAGQVQFI